MERQVEEDMAKKQQKRKTYNGKKKQIQKKQIQKKRHPAVRAIALFLSIILAIYTGMDYYPDQKLDHTEEIFEQLDEVIAEVEEVLWQRARVPKLGTSSMPELLPRYEGQPYVMINENVPEFTQEELNAKPFEYYGRRDFLGRCTMAEAMIGIELMPVKERESIGKVKPTGWHTVKYAEVDGSYLYNRCHLIAFELSGENANERNLITGTRFMNVEGMLPWENKIAQYVKETNDQVLYRVTPIFEGKNLVASGVHMEAQSIASEEIKFNIYVFNVQPGIGIDYRNGNSWQES